MEGVAEGTVEGALTQGLRLLRQHADRSPISFSPPESPILFSQSDELYTTAHDYSDFDVGIASQVEVVDSSADISEIPATPSALPPPPPLSAVSRPHSPPLRNTPIHNRLRPLISNRAEKNGPKCAYCSRPDGRKDTIQCITCQQHIHSVSCAGFSNHREARHTDFICRKCIDPPILHLPQVSTPRVHHRVVISQNGQLASEALLVNDQSSVDARNVPSSPSSPVAPPQQHQSHRSPDHAHLASRAAEPSIAPPPRLPFTLEELFEARVTLLRHCPKTARRELASLTNSTWSDVLNNADNPDNWIRAFAVAKLVLFLPGKKTFKNKAATVKLRIAAFREGRLEEL